MMTSYFNLLKYAATGIASPDMTYYDRMRASTLMGGAVQTLTGQPPLSFKADGSPLISWSMKGNGSQTGTPTPDNPIQPEFVGARTGQLFDISTAANGYYINDANGNRSKGGYDTSASDYIYIAGMSNITIYQTQKYKWGAFYDSSKTFVSGFNGYGTKTVPNTAVYVRLTIYNPDIDSFMVNEGQTALPYEPYGWKIPITCGGETNNVYLSAPLRKAIDGTDAVDTLQSTGALNRNVDENGDALVIPTTETITVPAIPTCQGENTLTVDTDLQPSEMTITFK